VTGGLLAGGSAGAPRLLAEFFAVISLLFAVCAKIAENIDLISSIIRSLPANRSNLAEIAAFISAIFESAADSRYIRTFFSAISKLPTLSPLSTSA
jgi:hypothetical protein